MSISNEQNLLSEGRYRLLPRLAPKRSKTPLIKALHKVGNAIKDMLFIFSIFELIHRLFSEQRIRQSITIDHLSPLAKKRLAEMERRIQHIAKIAGFTEPQKFKAVTFDTGYPAAAAGRSTIIISIEQLVKPEDLPNELSLRKLNGGEISEAQWLVTFKKWKRTNFSNENDSPPHISQAAVDYEIARSKAFLKQLKNRENKEKIFDAIIWHELGHCGYRHTLKRSWAIFAWKLLTPLTLGISSIFEKRMMNKLCRKQEKEADLFSAKKFNGTQGLTLFFQACLDLGRSLHKKYPERYDRHGNSLKDRNHPPITERMAYLTATRRMYGNF